MAFTKSRSVIPGCNSPLNRTRTDSGILRGHTACHGSKGYKTWTSWKRDTDRKTGVAISTAPTVSGKTIRLSHEWITPSPARKLTLAWEVIKAGKVWCNLTSLGFGYAAVWQKLCITKSALKPRAVLLALYLISGHWPRVSWLPTVKVKGSTYILGMTPSTPHAFPTIFCAKVYPTFDFRLFRFCKNIFSPHT